MADQNARGTRTRQRDFDPNGHSLARRYEMPKVELDLGTETDGRTAGVHLYWRSRLAGAEGLEKCSATEWNLIIKKLKITSRNAQGDRFTRASGRRVWRFTLKTDAMAEIFLRRWTEEPPADGSDSEATQDSRE
jgi:hypothetical protein